jgi:beta-glucanase (GH16 family)
MKLVCINIKNVIAGSIVLLILNLLSGCVKEAKQTLPQRNWELTWSDDFAGVAGSAPDAANWTYDIGTGTNGWGNAELQYYTNRASNVSLDGNGNLMITARAENYLGAGFTSARVNTKGIFEQTYGRFEARIKTPYGPGIWPAFWMLGSNVDAVTWPQCGEIDIMEQRGNQSYINNGSMHGPGYSGGGAITKSYALTNGRFDSDFHIYAIEWGPDYVDYFVDEKLYQRITPKDVKGEWVFDKSFFMILNVAVGGTYVGFPTTGTPFPQTMYIDYVKVYKQN